MGEESTSHLAKNIREKLGNSWEGFKMKFLGWLGCTILASYLVHVGLIKVGIVFAGFDLLLIGLGVALVTGYLFSR